MLPAANNLIKNPVAVSAYLPSDGVVGGGSLAVGGCTVMVQLVGCNWWSWLLWRPPPVAPLVVVNRGTCRNHSVGTPHPCRAVRDDITGLR